MLECFVVFACFSGNKNQNVSVIEAWLGNQKSCAVASPEQREVEQEEGSECREEGQDLPIACGEDIHLYDNQISPGPGQSCNILPAVDLHLIEIQLSWVSENQSKGFSKRGQHA